jgi:hypothetical protein
MRWSHTTRVEQGTQGLLPYMSRGCSTLLPTKPHCCMANYSRFPHSLLSQVSFTMLVEDSSHLLVSSGGRTYLVAIRTGGGSASSEMQTMGWSLVSQGSVKTLGWHWGSCPVHQGLGGVFRGGLKASAVMLCLVAQKRRKGMRSSSRVLQPPGRWGGLTVGCRVCAGDDSSVDG